MTIENYNDFLEYEKIKEETILKNIIDEMDAFNYLVLINSKIKLDGKMRNITSYQLADSMIHLFFDDGSDLLISRAQIHRLFGKKNEI